MTEQEPGDDPADNERGEQDPIPRRGFVIRRGREQRDQDRRRRSKEALDRVERRELEERSTGPRGHQLPALAKAFGERGRGAGRWRDEEGDREGRPREKERGVEEHPPVGAHDEDEHPSDGVPHDRQDAADRARYPGGG